MLKTIFSKVVWVGRTASTVFGVALVLALMLGVATAAFGDNGDFFKVGKSNTATKVSQLINNGTGSALDLRVQSGNAPLKVNSDTQVANLNADLLDGKDATKIVTDTTPTYEVGVFGSIATGQTSVTLTAECDAGDRTQSGGYINLDPDAEVEDNSLGSDSDWRVEINGAAGDSVTTRLRCYDFPPLHE